MPGQPANWPQYARRQHQGASVHPDGKPARPYVEGRLGTTLKGKVEAQDIAQEVVIKALRELPKSDVLDRDPFSWLCHLAEQCVIDAHRHFAASKRTTEREQAGNVPFADGSQDLIALLAASMTTPTQAAVRDERETNLRVAL